ncbi:MAG TPA: P-II family nitrogen regulator [Spirochaetia bacterium]|nr:P-II family nitrogen regulator [Spirochaetia bacterium]
MKLLVIVLNATEILEDVLEGLIETGISGATVVDSEGMGHIIEEVPLFAGVRDVFRSARPRNKIIFSVTTDSQAREVVDVLEKILGCAHEKGKGIAFFLPIESAIGIGKEAQSSTQ